MSWKNTTADKEFDLDDPRFTTPMSVISGLASGYCERRAAVDPTYSAANWNTTNKQSQTVSRLAANIAINHNIGTVSAYAADYEIFQEPQAWTDAQQQTKTYMDYFDNDLAALAHSYVTSGGVAYNGFDGLAVAASARADSDATVSNYDGYMVGTTATSGGIGGVVGTSEYAGQFLPIFAAGWAVERRDMLEELRYAKTDGDITAITHDGKSINIGTSESIMEADGNQFIRYAQIDAYLFNDSDIWYGWIYEASQVTLYTANENPTVGAGTLIATPGNYTRYTAGDRTTANMYSWRNTGLTPSVVYTTSPYSFSAGDNIWRYTNGNYTECGRISDFGDRKMAFTSGSVTKTGFERYTALDDLDRGRYCWSSGTSRVWTGYDNNLDPGDSIYKSVTGTEAGTVTRIDRTSITVYLSGGIIQNSYSYGRTYETLTMYLTTADGTYLRDKTQDANGQYAWTGAGGVIYTTTELPWTGQYTAEGAEITGMTVSIPTYQTAMTSACDAQHAAIVTDVPVTSDTGRIECETSGLQWYGREAKSVEPLDWWVAEDHDAANATVKLPVTGTVTISKFTWGTESIDTVTCPVCNMIDCRQVDDLSADFPYMVRVGAGYVVSKGSLVQAITMHGTGLGGKTAKVSMYIGCPYSAHSGYFFSSYLNSDSVMVSGVSTIGNDTAAALNNAGGTLIVCTGGTATLSGCTVDRALVEPQGSLVFETEDAKVSNCCILTGTTGGTTVRGCLVNEQTVASGADKVESCFFDFILGYTEYYSSVVLDTGKTYTDASRPTESSVIVKAGICRFEGMHWDSCSVRVHSGASCVLTNGADIDNLVLLPGATAIVSSSFIHGDLDIHRGAVCHMSGCSDNEHGVMRSWALNPSVYSGGTLTLNEFSDFNANNTDGDIWYSWFDTGAVVKLTSNGDLVTTPKGIYEWKEVHGCPTRSFVHTFFNHNLKVGNTQLHEGWNVIDVVVPAGATAVDLVTGDGSLANIPQVREVIYTGVISDEYYHFMGAGTTQIVGFSLCTIKVDGLDLADHYPEFTYRKFGDDHK